MKKLMIILSVLFLTEQLYAQKKEYYLTPVAIDGSVSVSMPKEYKRTNSGGQQTIAANGTYGSMVVIRTPNPADSKDVKNEKGLNNVFKEYVKKVQESLSEGTILEDHDVTVGKLEMHDFVLQVDTGSGLQSRHFRLLYTKDVSYTFEYLYEDLRKDLAVGEMNAFLASIAPAPELDRTDQYITTTQGDRPMIVSILLFGLLPLTVIIGAIVFFRRRTVSY